MYVRYSYQSFQSLAEFQVHSVDSRVHFESDAANLAASVARMLPTSIDRVERELQGRFLHPTAVYVCYRRQCFDPYAPSPVALGATSLKGDRIFLDGSRLTKARVLRRILISELVQAFWNQRGSRCDVYWWRHGLAALVSARASIGGETVIHPESAVVFDDATTCWGTVYQAPSPMSLSDYQRQAASFVNYLRTRQPLAFDHTLQKLRNGKRLFPALETSYFVSVQTLWEQWRTGLMLDPGPASLFPDSIRLESPALRSAGEQGHLNAQYICCKEPPQRARQLRLRLQQEFEVSSVDT